MEKPNGDGDGEYIVMEEDWPLPDNEEDFLIERVTMRTEIVRVRAASTDQAKEQAAQGDGEIIAGPTDSVQSVELLLDNVVVIGTSDTL